MIILFVTVIVVGALFSYSYFCAPLNFNPPNVFPFLCVSQSSILLLLMLLLLVLFLFKFSALNLLVSESGHGLFISRFPNVLTSTVKCHSF